MANVLTQISVKNYRSLAAITVDLHPLNVLFGPNGAGKSSFLDTIWFVRDCAIRSVEFASGQRSHGIGVLYDRAVEGDDISITLSTEQAKYTLSLGLSAGRIEAYAGEELFSKSRNIRLIDRGVGRDQASFFNLGSGEAAPVSLREPKKISLGRYLDFDPRAKEALNLDRLLHFVHFYHSRSFNLFALKQKGSEGSHEEWLWDRGDNLWSVLRNLLAHQAEDNRYETIVGFMRKAMPTLDDIAFEAIGPTNVYSSFLEKGRRMPIKASGVSDGHLQLLLLLTALFAEHQDRDSLLMFDEPEVSLHPWAIAVFADAVKLAVTAWNRQVFLASHSPVLLSQFSPQDILVTDAPEGKTRLIRLSDMQDAQDLLEDYTAGSLYMAGVLARQSVQTTDETGAVS